MGKIKHFISKLLLTSTLTLGLINPATALDFIFSFSNTTGSIDGTVTGRILGLTDNATSTPSGVFVDSAPGPLRDVHSFNFVTLANNPPPGQTLLNTFIVTNQNITR